MLVAEPTFLRVAPEELGRRPLSGKDVSTAAAALAALSCATPAFISVADRFGRERLQSLPKTLMNSILSLQFVPG